MSIRVSAVALLCLGLSACGSLPSSSPQAAKSVSALSEGQLQEAYIARRDEGRRLLESKRFGPALDSFLAALRIRPASSDALLGIGRSYAGLEYYEKAKEYFDHYLEIEKDRDSAVYYSIALVYGDKLFLGEAAVRLLTKAIEAATAKAPVNGDQGLLAISFYQRAQFLQRLGKRDDAVSDYGRALDIAQRGKDTRLVVLCKDALGRLAAQSPAP